MWINLLRVPQIKFIILIYDTDIDDRSHMSICVKQVDINHTSRNRRGCGYDSGTADAVVHGGVCTIG